MYIASIASEVKLHTWPSGQLVNTYKTSSNCVLRTISWSKDGKWIITVPSKGPAEIIGIRDNVLKHLSSLEILSQPTCAVFQNLTKRYMALGTDTGNVLLYDIKQRSVKTQFPKANSTVFQVEFTPHDNYLFAGCEDGSILSYNCSTMNCSGSYKIPKTRTLSTMRTHPTKRNLIMAGSEEGIVAVWDFYRNNIVYKNQAHQAIVTDVVFAPRRDDLIVTCGLDRKFVFWDITTNSQILQHILERSPTSIDFCPDGIGLAIGTQAGTIYIYDTRQMNAPTYVFKAHNSFVKQLLFQKNITADENNDFTISRNRESGDAHVPIEESVEDQCDSFGGILCNNGPNEHNIGDHQSPKPHDSFLVQLGLSCSSFEENQGPISVGVRKLLDSQPNLLEAVDDQDSKNSPKPGDYANFDKGIQNNRRSSCGTPSYQPRRSNPLNYIPEVSTELDTPVVSSLKHRQLSKIMSSGRKSSELKDPPKCNSTPKADYARDPNSPLQNMSPILGQTSKPFSEADMEQIKSVVKDVVKQEVKEQLEEFHQTLKFDIMEALMQMRRHFLDLQMCVVKEAVLLENNINKVRDDLRKEE